MQHHQQQKLADINTTDGAVAMMTPTGGSSDLTRQQSQLGNG